VVVAWDSSNDDFTITGNHTYSSAGTPTVTITVTGPDSRTGNASTAADVTSLTVTGETFSAVQGGNFSGNVATFTDADNAGNQTGNYTASIDWLGDGSDVTTGTVAYNSVTGNFTVSGNNTFTSAGTFNPVVTITDTATGNSTATGTATGNVTGIIATAANPVAATQDAAIGNVTLATFVNTTNPTGGNYTASIDWLGDGTDMGNGTITTDGQGNYTITGNISSTTYPSAGTFNPIVTITDTSSGNITAVSSGTVVDVAGITATADPINIVLGGNFTGTVATFTDTAPDASTLAGNYSATINWGDGNTAGSIAWDSTNNDFTVTDVGNHTYSAAGMPTVIVTITDLSDGRSSVSSGTVANVTSLTTRAESITGVQGQSFTGVVATFSDINSGTTAGDYTATIDWGDGNYGNGTITGNDTTGFTVSGSNIFAAAGNLTITVTVTDPSGASARALSIGNIAGIVASPVTMSNVTEGQPINNVVLATFVNTASGTGNDNYSATIDWGNGSPVTVTPTLSGGVWTVRGSLDAGNVTAGMPSPTIAITDLSNSSLAATISSGVDQMDVTAAALNATALPIDATQGTIFSGNVATFTDGDASTTPDDFTASIDWGDGNSSNGIITAGAGGGSFTVAGSHTYADNGSYTVQVSVTDIYDGGNDTSSGTAAVAVGGLYNTGIGPDGSLLGAGAEDTQYTVAFVSQTILGNGTGNGSTYGSIPPLGNFTSFAPTYVMFGVTQGNDTNYPFGNSTTSGWIPDPDSSTSEWIGNASGESWDNSAYPPDAPGYYDYRTTFFLGNTTDLSTFTLKGRWVSDNTALDILVNGSSSGATNLDAADPGTTFGNWSAFSLSNGFKHGNNTLDFIVENGLYNGESDSVNGGPTGLRVEFTPPVQVSIVATQNGSVGTGTDDLFTISRTGNTSGNLTVYYTLGGTGQAGPTVAPDANFSTENQDYAGAVPVADDPGLYAVTIPAGQNSAQLDFTPLENPDNLYDSSTIVVQLQANAEDYSVGSATESGDAIATPQATIGFTADTQPATQASAAATQAASPAYWSTDNDTPNLVIWADGAHAVKQQKDVYGGAAAYTQKNNIPLVPVNTVADLVQAIIDTASKPDEKQTKLDVVIMAHGDIQSGPVIESPRGNYDNIIPCWSDFMAVPPGDSGFSADELKQFRQNFIKEKEGFVQVKDHVREITFTSCDIADTRDGQQLLRVIANVLDCKIRVFKAKTDTTANENRIEVGPNKDVKPQPKTRAEFVFETTGS